MRNATVVLGCLAFAAWSGCMVQTDKSQEESGSSTSSTGNTGSGGSGPKCDTGKCDCHPLTCAAAGANCGVIPDGCGGSLGCGGCPAHEVCGGGGAPNVCGSRCEADQKVCDDTCVQVFSDPENCGDCGHRCDLPNALAACQQGKCKVDRCDPCFADCNCDPSDGCEVNVKRDLEHCGECGHACKPAHAVAVCNQGRCEIDHCDPDFADCDADPRNGCEADLDRDRENCGACGVDCPEGARCVEGSCVSPPPPSDGGVTPPPDLAVTVDAAVPPADLASAGDLLGRPDMAGCVGFPSCSATCPCPSGFTCMGGICMLNCLPGTCSATCPCPTGQVCIGTICVPPADDLAVPPDLAMTPADLVTPPDLTPTPT